eukprot:442748-Pyramimonas_sp.AAC.1
MTADVSSMSLTSSEAQITTPNREPFQHFSNISPRHPPRGSRAASHRLPSGAWRPPPQSPSCAAA